MPTLNQVQYRLSGGLSNANPALALGGPMSSQAVGPDIFDNVDSLDALRGQVEYRCVYVNNAGPDALPLSLVYVSTPNPVGRIAIGLGSVGQSEPSVADERTAPAGVIFGGQSINTPVEAPELAAGQSFALWLRRTVQQRTQAGQEAFEVAIAFDGGVDAVLSFNDAIVTFNDLEVSFQT